MTVEDKRWLMNVNFHGDPRFEDRHARAYLAWDEAPPAGAEVRKLELDWAGSKLPFPGSIRTIFELAELWFPAPLARTLRPEHLPPSLIHLGVSSAEFGAIPKDAKFPAIRSWRANRIRFEPHQFENITTLGCNVFPNDQRLSKLGAFKNLSDLGIGNAKAEDLERGARLPLKRLSFGGDRLETLEALRNHQQIESLDISLCPRLIDISVLETMPQLRRVHIAFCKRLSDLSVLLKLKGLKLMHAYGFPAADVTAVADELRARGVAVHAPPDLRRRR
jgi:hypothetical protein